MIKRIIFTDFRRAQRKKSFIIGMSIVVLLMVIITIVAFIKPANALDLADSSETNAKGLAFLNSISIAFGLASLLVGIPIFQAVFSDDFKSRTMQTAIGRGISRRRLVLCRFYESIALLLESHLIFTVCGFILGLIVGASFKGLLVMTAKLFFDALLIVANIAIAMWILYMTLNPTGGLVMYILLAVDAFRLILALADMIPFLKDNGIKISNILPGGVHQLARNNLFGYVPSLSDVSDIEKILSGTVEPNYLKALGFTAILVGVFIILPVFLSHVVFKKKELEF